VGLLPKKYRSSAAIETGLIDYKSVRVDQANPFLQEFEIESKFSNFFELMKSRAPINALTKRLILHDLRPKEGQTAFRKLELDEKSNITQEQIERYLNQLETRLDSSFVSGNDTEHLFVGRILEKALGYDYETIREKIDIKRVGKSQYMLVEYASEKPDLTYFVIKNFVDDFINSYYIKKDTIENKSYAFYHELVQDKKRRLDNLNQRQVTYAKSQGLVAPVEQAQALVTQIKEMEMARDDEQKKLKGYEQEYAVYEKQFDGYKKFIRGDYSENTTLNNEVKNIDLQLAILNNRWVESGMRDPNVTQQIEELKKKRAITVQKIALSRQDQTNPTLQKNNELFMKYVDAESQKEASKQKVVALQKRIDELYASKKVLVRDNAEWNKLSQDIEIAASEYKYAIDKQNQADVIKQSGEEETPVRLIDPPIYPYKPESSKRVLLSAFAGVGGGTIATVILFMLAYFDRSLGSTFQYNKQIGLPLLAPLNKLNRKRWGNFDTFFNTGTNAKEPEHFKESVRKIRHDIEASGAKSFLVVSPKEQEGKSFTIASLAYSFALKNKKVLIIDTNFKNNTLSGLSIKPADENLNEASQHAKPTATPLEFAIPMASVDIIGNKGGHNSPSELLAGVDFKKKMEHLGKSYDYIFMEAASMNKYSDARELVDFADKVIPVFDATTTVSDLDENSLNFLRSLNGKMLGGVLNKADLKNL
jgi:Mrp family chromosome partitioning ATPase/uncharacterized protein involved in exopolysaccharide biosynthesis